jgi:hypothetical protein
LRWLGIRGATIKTQIKGIKKYKWVDVYVLVYHVTSNNWLSRIYKIDSTFTSYSAIDDFRTLYQEVDRKEGRYRKHAIVNYDHATKTAYFENYTDKSKKEFPIPLGVRDGLGSVYYFRTLPLKVGDQAHFDIVLSEVVYDFYGDVHDRKVRKVPHLGKRDAIRVEPYGFLDGKKVKDGTMNSF